MSIETVTPPPVRIEIPGDVLVRDDVFCVEVLNGATRRTAKNYERDGLPYVMISGRKFRPLEEGRRWLAARIQRSEPKRRHRARA